MNLTLKLLILLALLAIPAFGQELPGERYRADFRRGGPSARQVYKEMFRDQIRHPDDEVGNWYFITELTIDQRNELESQGVKLELQPERYIIATKPGFSARGIYARHSAKFGVHPKDIVHEDWFSALLTHEQVKRFRQDPRVKNVNKNILVSVAQNFQQFPGNALDRLDQRDQPLDQWYSWDWGGSERYNLFIIDTGVRSTHVQFNNYYISRVQSIFDAINDGVEDCNGHGTAMASNAAGATYGIARHISIKSLRVFGCGNQTDLHKIADAMQFLIDRAGTKGYNGVVNMSFVVQVYVDFLADKANELAAVGYTPVAAAGNFHYDTCNSTPAGASNVIAVGWLHPEFDQRITSTGFGPCIDIFAPGQAGPAAFYLSDTSTSVVSGTSSAAAFVSGALAVENARFMNTLNATQLKQRLIDASTKDRIVPSTLEGSPNRILFAPMTTH